MYLQLLEFFWYVDKNKKDFLHVTDLSVNTLKKMFQRFMKEEMTFKCFIGIYKLQKKPF